MMYDWNLNGVMVLVDVIFTNSLLALACILVSNNLRFYRPKKNRYLYILVLCIAISGLWIAVIKFGFFIANKYDQQFNLFAYDEAYNIFVTNSMPVRFDIGFLVIGCMALVSMLWYHSEEQKETEQRKADTEVLAKDAELYSLRQQLQPHFLFNSLNSISALVGSKPEQARKMIQQLSEFLRGTLKKEEHAWVTLAEEIQQLELYLEIEKVRFGHRLNTEIFIDETAKDLILPPLLLQPIVENAIKFGLYDTTEAVTIRLNAHKNDNELVITVKNPFDPETSSPKHGLGFGLSSATRRLFLLFSRTDLLTTQSTENLFTTIVKIPQHDQSNTDR